MPQEFHVLQCHKCKTFQVQQVKKVLKWSCKLCGEKQSVLRVYGQGSGADCRKHVQNLNKLRGELETTQEEKIVSAKSVEEADVHFHHFQIDASEVEGNIQNSSSSKWEKYVEPLITEDGVKDVWEDESRYTTDRAQYNTLNKQYRKHKRDINKHYQPYPRDKSKMDKNSKWKNQTPNNTGGGNFEDGFSEFDQSPDSKMNRLPPGCLSSKPAKRTKWDNFLGAQNLANTLVSSQESNFHEQPNRNVLKKAFAPETKIVKPDFNLLDSFLDEEFEEPISNSMTANNIPKMVNGKSKLSTRVQSANVAFGKSTVSSGIQAQNSAALKTTISNCVPQKKSKWAAYQNTSPEHDSEFYIPDDNSLDYEKPNYHEPNNDENAPDNFDFSQSQKEVDKGTTLFPIGDAQVKVPSYSSKSNTEIAPSISGSKTFNALKCDSKTPCNKGPKSPTIAAKSCSKDKMFQVNDFDDAEFEFVI